MAKGYFTSKCPDQSLRASRLRVVTKSDGGSNAGGGRPNLLRTGKLVLIAHDDPFRASDVTTIDAGSPNDGGNSTLELQKYERTIVK
jgi:hypothetical protein